MLRRRKPGRRSRLWPACLCSTAVRDEQDTYTAAPTPTPTADDDDKMADMTSPDVDVGDGLCTIQMSGGAPFGFRLSDDAKGRLVVSKVRRRGAADEAGLREGDVLLTVNGKTCRGLNCGPAMDLIESSGQNVTVRVSRGSVKPADVNRTASAAAETTTSSAVNPSQMTRRTHSVQERHGQTVYLPSTDPVSADSPSSATVTPGATTTGPRPSAAVAGGRPGRAGEGATSAGAMTVSAPPGVEVHHDADKRTFTLTFGVNDISAPDTTTKISAAQLVWQPPATTTAHQHAPADDVSDAGARETGASKPPPLSRILTESTEEPPDTPTSPDAHKKKTFMDSAFYDDPEHKYPTVEEQIALARRVAQSVLAPANVNSRGHKMFVKRRDRSVRWEAGYKPPETGDQDDAAKSTSTAQTDAPPTSGDVTAPPPAPVPLTSFMFAPKLPDPEKLDPEKLDALSSEELERLMLMEKKSTHTNVAPQVCFNIADDLRNMKGRGARLFAKRQAKSESWTVSADNDDTTTTEPAAEPSASIQQKLSAQHKPPSPAGDPAVPVNRLKEMVELPRPAMTPWDAAAQYGTVDPAFAHLTAAGDSSVSGRDSGGAGRVKSWSGDQDPAASLAAAMTSSLKLRSKPSSSSSSSSSAAGTGAGPGESTTGYQPVKFSAAPS